jgi:hypothetical protein
MIAELVAEGIEGGSWRTILHEWTYFRYKKLHEEWSQRPPLRWWAVSYFKYKPAPKQIAVPRMTDQSQPQSQSQFQLLQGHRSATSISTPNVTNIAEWVSKQPGKVFKG